MKQYKIIVPLVFLLAIQYFYFEQKIESVQQQETQIPQPATQPVARVMQLPAFSVLAEQAKASVVSIDVFSENSRRRIDGMGSGFVISSDGYLLTNHHVTQDSQRLVIKLADGSEYDAELVGSDPETDLSLLKIEANGLTPFEFGNVDETKVGSWVVAIGAPFGFEQTVTAGIISAKGRSVGEQYVPYIQTDVAINVGNSGGPLINMDGKVIGVNSKIISTDGGSVGLSFAIPIDLAVDVVNQLKNDGRVKRGFLGVRYQEVTREIAESFSLAKSHGALIYEVTPNSPAAKGGLQRGDIVTAVDGKRIINYTELPFLIGRLRPGMETELSIVREGETDALKIVVGSRRPQEVIADLSPEAPPESDNLLGIHVSQIPQDIKESFDLEEGVVIDKVDVGPASEAGLREGDVILSIQTTPISTVEEFYSLLSAIPENSAFAVLITRPGQGSRYVVIDLN